jgi:2'-5' RNA ligase
MQLPKPQRVFFALWPDAAAAARLHALAREQHQLLNGRVSREDSLHCTLVFIGNVDAERLPDLQAAADGIQSPGFRMTFDQSGCWRHNRIVYLGMRQVPEALLHLQSTLDTRLKSAGFNTEQREYRPHLTLLRKAECTGATKENPATEPVGWAVRDFVLVRSSLSVNGSRYEQIGRWPLL